MDHRYYLGDGNELLRCIGVFMIASPPNPVVLIFGVIKLSLPGKKVTEPPLILGGK